MLAKQGLGDVSAVKDGLWKLDPMDIEMVFKGDLRDLKGSLEIDLKALRGAKRVDATNLT